MLRKKINILIIEDNPDDLDLLLLELGKGNFDFDYTHCQTKEEVQAVLTNNGPDIVISDHQLPQFSGEEALSLTKEFDKDLPFILVSGHIAEEDAVILIVNEGADDFILKDKLQRLNPAIVREIKNRQLKKEFLRNTRELNKLSLVAKQSHNGIIITDSDGRVEWVNSAYEKITGYTLRESFGKKPGSMLQGKDSDPYTVKYISDNLKKQHSFQAEILNYRKNGDEIWLKLDISPIVNEKNELINYIAIQEDVTERKLNEQLLNAINDISTSLLNTDNFIEISNIVTEKLMQHFGFADCVIYECDHGNKNLTQVAAYGPKKHTNGTVDAPLTLEFGQGIVGFVAENGKAEIIADTSQDDRYILDDQHRYSEIAVPILLDGEVIGVIDSEHKDRDFYTDRDLKNLSTVAGVIATKFKAAQEHFEKQQAQLELEEAETKLKSLTDNVPGIIIRYIRYKDGTDGALYISDGLKEIFELEPAQALENVQLIWDQVIPEDIEELAHTINKAIDTLTDFECLYRIKTPSDKIKWMHSKGSPRAFENGSVIIDAIVTDISKEKEIELELSQKEKQLTHITSNMNAVVVRYLLNDDGITGKFTYASAKVKEIFGVSPSEILGDENKLWDLTVPEDYDLVNDKYNDAVKKLSSFQIEYRIKTPTGVLKWIEAQGTVSKLDNGTIFSDTIFMDITERVVKDQIIKENEERLRTLTNNIPGVVLRYHQYEDGSNKIDFISAQAESLYGVSAQEILDDNSKIWDLILPEDIDEMINTINISAETNTVWNYIYRVKTPDGKLKYLQGIGTPRPKVQDDITTWDTIVLDITNEVESEQSVKEINRLLLQAQKIGKIGDWHYDPVTDAVHWSNQMFTIYERDPELGPPPISEILSGYYGKDQEFHNKQLEKCLNDLTEIDISVELITEKNNTRQVRIIGVPVINDDKVVSIDGIVQDITDEYVASQRVLESEKLLKENEFRLEAAIAGADLGVWDTNFKLGTNIVNKRWFEMLGYEFDPNLNTLDFFNEIIHPDDRELAYNEIKRIENGGVNNFELTLRLKAKDGTYHYILDRGRVVEFDEDDSAVRAIGTHLDITKTKRLQDQIKDSLDEKNILLSEIHHRVKNNLAIVSGLLEIKAIESKNKELSSTLMDMGQRIKSIAGVHEQLYNNNNFVEIPILNYINNLIGNINATMFNKKNVAFNLNISPDIQININQAVPMGLLINELITNSFKYAFSDQDNPQVRIQLTSKNDKYRFIYSDNGPGYDEKIFKEAKSLGLTLVKTLLAQLEATHTFSSENGFHLEFEFGPKEVGAHAALKV